jgi:hypothetical protein
VVSVEAIVDDPSTKTWTPAIGMPGAEVTVPCTTFDRNAIVRSPSSGTVPEPASKPPAAAAIEVPRNALMTADPVGSVSASPPAAVNRTPAIGAWEVRSTTVTRTSRGCSGVGLGVGSRGRLPQPANTAAPSTMRHAPRTATGGL